MSLEYVDNTINLPRLPERACDSHKGDFGRALLVGGSRGMAGAIALAGKATLRGGAGLVTLAVPESVQDIVAGFEPSYMTLGLPVDEHGALNYAPDAAELEQAAIVSRATAAAVGPGLGQSESNRILVRVLYENLTVPLVIDADGLNCLDARRALLVQHRGERILTPHPGEFVHLMRDYLDHAPETRAQLRDQTGALCREALCQLAVKIAHACRIVLVLKGHRTLITDGQSAYLNATGNPGMATGGAGDVLTGVIAALLCQGLGPLDAARLGVHLHGRAGDLAADGLGEASMIASDLIEFLPQATREIAGT